MRVITQAMGLRLPREGTEKMTNALTNKPSTFLKSMSRNSRISPYWPNSSVKPRTTTKP
jgi:hypothetical protein